MGGALLWIDTVFIVFLFGLRPSMRLNRIVVPVLDLRFGRPVEWE
jgi:hypothetical protein